jgi:hypothetical protein
MYCPGAWSEDERQLRAAFATVLQENAQLHKAINAALRSGGISTAAAAAAVRAMRTCMSTWSSGSQPTAI